MAAPAAEKRVRFKFIGETVAELKKVTWLSRNESFYLTGLVLLFSIVVGALLGGLDYLLSWLVNVLFLS
jgi:preprotein translocase subunit SecE